MAAAASKKGKKGRRAPGSPVRIIAIGAAAVAVIAIGIAVYLNRSSADAVYVVSSVTYYEDEEATVTTYTLDENGSVIGSSTDDGSSDISYTVDENGFYTERTYTYEDDDGETVTVTETRTIEESDDEGRPLTVSCVTTYSSGTTYESTVTYAYRDSGMLKSVTTAITGGYTVVVTYNSRGYMKTYELTWEEVTSSERLYEYDYETEDGVVVGCTITNQDDEYGTIEFTYDDNGNLLTYTANGTLLYEYTYTKVNDPSLAAQIASELFAVTPLL